MFDSIRHKLRYNQLDNDNAEAAEYHVKESQPETDNELSWKRGFFVLLLLYVLTVMSVIVRDPGFTFNAGYHASFPNFVPETPTKMTSFVKDPSFEDFARWEEFLPSTLGYVAVSEPSRYGLKRGWPLHLQKGEAYSISMFHQLHCLVTLKDGFTSLITGQNLTEMDSAYHHCFDYIRQSILCSGDTVMEPFSIIHNMLAKQVDGYGVKRECRDWEALFEFAREHHAFSLKV